MCPDGVEVPSTASEVPFSPDGVEVPSTASEVPFFWMGSRSLPPLPRYLFSDGGSSSTALKWFFLNGVST